MIKRVESKETYLIGWVDVVSSFDDEWFVECGISKPRKSWTRSGLKQADKSDGNVRIYSFDFTNSTLTAGGFYGENFKPEESWTESRWISNVQLRFLRLSNNKIQKRMFLDIYSNECGHEIRLKLF